MDNKIKNQVKIVGAGISGLSAAITLAKNKVNVEVVEKNSHPGGRFNRDFQGLRNFGNEQTDPIKEVEKLGIYLTPYKTLKKIVRCSRSYRFELHSDRPIYYLFIRGESKKSIDSQLEKIAISENVIIKYNVKSNADNADIIATGPSKADSLAYGGIYQDTNIDDTGYVFLDKYYSPNGYFYVLPGEEKGEVEVINATFDPTVNMHTIKKLYDQMIQKNIVVKDLLYGSTRSNIQGGIGCCTLLDVPYQQNQYYVGEAAGLQDVTAGFGIRYAIKSGYLAAQAALTGKDYNKMIKKTFSSQLEFERKRRQHFQQLTNDDLDQIFQMVNQKFGHELTIEDYESLRGVI